MSNKLYLPWHILDPGAFDSISGEVVSTTAFILEKISLREHESVYLRLVEGNSEAEKEATMRRAIQNPRLQVVFQSEI